MLDTPCIEYTTTTIRERNLPDTLTASSYIVLAELGEVLLEATQLVVTSVDDVLALFFCNLVHLLWSQLRVLAQTVTIATKTIATSVESDTGTECLDEALAYTLCCLGNRVLVWPVAVIFCFLQICEQYLVD